MDEVVAALAEQQAELSSLLHGRDDADWHLPSRCEGWTVADVVLHLAQTNEMAIASVDRRIPEYLEAVAREVGPPSSVDDGAALMVARERDRPVADLRRRWQSTVDDFLARLRTADFHDRVTWVAGELSIRTLVTTRLAETWIHTGDVAAAFGIAPAPTDRLRHIVRLAWRTVPYAFARAGRELSGPVAFELVGPSGSSWDFVPEEAPRTTIRGDALELCLVAARRVEPADTTLRGDGPDAQSVLELVRTYA
ncbi:MAG: wyosine base formation [Acidimicrobiales bacterium]|nr:wyosine base formation [Acidimicrobiales bacterium]